MHYSVKDRLSAKIRVSKSTVFLRADFAGLGHCRQVSRALSELEQEHVLVRVGYGIYSKPMAPMTPKEINRLVSSVKARLGKRVKRMVTFGNTTIQLGVKAKGRQNAQSRLDALKQDSARTVLESVDMDDLRRHSLSNLERWKAGGSWCSAFAEWEDLMAHGSDAEVTAAMTGTDENANRLRQSAPYVGLLPRNVAAPSHGT